MQFVIYKKLLCSFILVLFTLVVSCSGDKIIFWGDTSDSSIDGDIEKDAISEHDIDTDNKENTEQSTAESGDNDNIPCTYDEMRCRDEQELQRCGRSGLWEFYRTCPEGRICKVDDCEDITPIVCTAGKTYCSEDQSYVKRCNPDGDGYDFVKDCGFVEICENGICETAGAECNIHEGCMENDQYCLTESPEYEVGYCARYCDLHGVECPEGWLCKYGMCEAMAGYCKSDTDCQLDEFCDQLFQEGAGRCKRYCYLPGENCPEEYECSTEIDDLNYGRCVPVDYKCKECSDNMSCEPGWHCEIFAGSLEGCCVPDCKSDNDCSGMLSCYEGRCQYSNGENNCNGGCPPGYICDVTFNQCVVYCEPCGLYECCFPMYAPNCGPCDHCENPIVCSVLVAPCCGGYYCSAVVYGVLGYCI